MLPCQGKEFSFFFPLLSSSFHFCLRDNVTGLYFTQSMLAWNLRSSYLYLECWDFSIYHQTWIQSFGFNNSSSMFFFPGTILPLLIVSHFHELSIKATSYTKPAATVSGSPADAVPRTTGCVLATLTSQMPSLWPIYSFTSWQMALDVVVLKLETI